MHPICEYIDIKLLLEDDGSVSPLCVQVLQESSSAGTCARICLLFCANFKLPENKAARVFRKNPVAREVCLLRELNL